MALVPYAESEGYVIRDVQGNINAWTQQTISMKGKGYATISYGKPVSVKEKHVIESYSVMAGNTLHIPLNWVTQNAELRMMDLTGREISLSELESGINMVNIDIKRLSPGIYILSIRDDNQAKHCMIHIDG